MKLINVEEFISSYCSGCESRDALCESGELCDMFRYILNFPSVDAVPVVRCTDCRHWHFIDGDICGGNQYGSCDIVDCPNGEPPVETKEDDFCNYGEKLYEN